MNRDDGRERGLTLTEVTVVMILGTMIMGGLVGFYLSSQGVWLDASTQVITQREASLVVSAMRDSIRKSGRATDEPSPDASHRQLSLFRKREDTMPYYQFWWNPSDSLIHAGSAVGDPAAGPIVVSRAERFEVTATPQAVRIDLRLRTADGGRVDMGSLAVFKN